MNLNVSIYPARQMNVSQIKCIVPCTVVVLWMFMMHGKLHYVLILEQHRL